MSFESEVREVIWCQRDMNARCRKGMLIPCMECKLDAILAAHRKDLERIADGMVLTPGAIVKECDGECTECAQHADCETDDIIHRSRYKQLEADQQKVREGK